MKHQNKTNKNVKLNKANNKTRKTRDNFEDTEGFIEGFGAIKRAIKKAINKVKDTFMKPFNSFKKLITAPIRTLQDFFTTILCLAVYLESVFKWFSDTFIVLSKYFANASICFVFWLLDSFVACFQFILIDVILNILFVPASIIGQMLGYPFIASMRIEGENKKRLYENTNLLRLMVKGIDSMTDGDLYTKCFEIGSIKPFPTYYS